MTEFHVVASYKTAASLYGGTQHIKRKGETMALCNRDASDWMFVKVAELADIESAWTCSRCQKVWAREPVA